MQCVADSEEALEKALRDAFPAARSSQNVRLPDLDRGLELL
jgi:hypothetical protein